MLAAMVKISKVMEKEVFLKEMDTSLQHKFAKKPEVLEGNRQALRQAFDAVECISSGSIPVMQTKQDGILSCAG